MDDEQVGVVGKDAKQDGADHAVDVHGVELLAPAYRVRQVGIGHEHGAILAVVTSQHDEVAARTAAHVIRNVLRTEEALRRMEKIPVFARGVAKTAIHRYAIEKGHTIISNTVVDAAVGHILPKGAMDAMRALGGSLDAAGIDRDKMQADDAVAKDLMGSTLSGMMTQVVEEKPKTSEATQAYLDRMSQSYYVCDGCGYIGKGDTPVKCPVCNAEGNRFKQVDKSIFDAAAKAEGGVETDVAYDDGRGRTRPGRGAVQLARRGRGHRRRLRGDHRRLPPRAGSA